MVKIWFKTGNPTKIISTGKSVGNPDEDFIESNLIPEDDEFYEIQGGAVVRKAQEAIDAVIAIRQAKIDAKEAAIAAKQQALIVNLPSWQQVSDAIDSATTIAALKVIVKKIARVVYWMAKNKEE